MNRILSLILCIALVAGLAACGQENPKFTEPVQLYYRNLSEEDSVPDSVIGSVTVEGTGRTADLTALLNDYLAGTEGFARTFPEGTRTVLLEITDGSALLILSTEFAELTGMDLTLACACLTKTVLGLTGATALRIQAYKAELDGAEEIVMSEGTLELEDLYIPIEETEGEA